MEEHELHRGLNARQVTFMALGAAIGVGLFLGSAQAIRQSGPSILLAYLLSGIAIFFIMRALGEMAVDQPISGSFSAYAKEHLGSFAGYLTGWNYWAMMIGAGIAETTAVGIYMKFWFPGVEQWVWVCASVLTIGALNFLSVKIYGELEFWFTLIKIVAIFIFIALGLAIILFGIGNSGQPIYFNNLWEHGGWFPNGVFGMLLAIPVALCGFSGTEMVGIAAGEAMNPTKTIPKAVNSVLWRILVCYLGALLVILSLYPWNQIDIHGSPFVSTFNQLGISNAAGIINFVVITAALSAFNCVTFSSGRILHNLAMQGQAPKTLSVVTHSGVPVRAILFSLACLSFGVVLNYLLPTRLFSLVIALISFNAIATWFMVLLTHYKFRIKCQKTKTKLNGFPMPMWPIASLVVMAFLCFILCLMFYVEETRISILVGIGWVALISTVYWLFLSKKT